VCKPAPFFCIITHVTKGIKSIHILYSRLLSPWMGFEMCALGHVAVFYKHSPIYLNGFPNFVSWFRHCSTTFEVHWLTLLCWYALPPIAPSTDYVETKWHVNYTCNINSCCKIKHFLCHKQIFDTCLLDDITDFIDHKRSLDYRKIISNKTNITCEHSTVVLKRFYLFWRLKFIHFIQNNAEL
jgi:hypothetical protein